MSTSEIFEGENSGLRKAFDEEVSREQYYTEKRCECGSEEFWVNEEYTWTAFVEKKVLECHKPDTIITSIICKKCDKELQQDYFEEINFN